MPVDRLRRPLRECLAGDNSTGEITLEATNRRGRKIQCRVTCSPLLNSAREIEGIILVMEELDGAAEG